MKRVLMIAYHFPPLAGSSGIQRTLRFVQHLPQFGWQPLVLSAHPRAFERCDNDLMASIPTGTVVRRAFALDTARHLALGGRYVGAMARPDRWVSWRFDAVRVGMRLIRQYQPDMLWSTYPIATAHLIGAELHRRSGIPWCADFRDPMAQDGYPADPKDWQSFKSVEEQAFTHAALNFVTTPGALRLYRERYPLAAERTLLLENGFDEDSFARAEQAAGAPGPLNPGAVTLLHSGIVYPSERDPTQLFEALGRLLRAGALTPQGFRLRFRAPVHDELLRSLAARYGVESLVEICPTVGYAQALREMLATDALLVMQGANCNEQIPAKIYEYLRAGRPILCLTDPSGDTAAVLSQAGAGVQARLDSADEIATALPAFAAAVRAGSVPMPSAETVRAASREGRTERLVSCMEQALARVRP